MSSSGCFIDANLLVLLVVGGAGRGLISKHRRLQNFSEKDYEILLELIARFNRVYVTPNTLTETSNLLYQHKEPERSQLFERLRIVIEDSKEVIIASADASNNEVFTRLGLTDAVLLETVTEETPLVTVDLSLYLAASAKGQGMAVNFTHYRPAD